jgi:hypothetical protein
MGDRPLGFEPATMTLMTTSSSPGSGIGTSWIEVWSSGIGWTITSFILIFRTITVKADECDFVQTEIWEYLAGIMILYRRRLRFGFWFWNIHVSSCWLAYPLSGFLIPLLPA